MKYIKLYEIFGLSKKTEKGDKLIQRLFEIIKEENITIFEHGGYRVDIDDRIYSFSSLGWNDKDVSIYDKSQIRISPTHGEYVSGKPISTYPISRKSWKELEKLYKKQQEPDTVNDFEVLDDLTRSVKKYNL